MKTALAIRAGGLSLMFLAGFFTHLLYQRWNPASSETAAENIAIDAAGESGTAALPAYPVSLAPLGAPAVSQVELPVLQAREVDKIRALSGAQAKVRGRIFRVGHSGKSNTYFLSFGPSREALTGVVFSSAVELFERQKILVKSLEGKEVEVAGEIKDHPQYGLEIVIENPSQVRIFK